MNHEGQAGWDRRRPDIYGDPEQEPATRAATKHATARQREFTRRERQAAARQRWLKRRRAMKRALVRGLERLFP